MYIFAYAFNQVLGNDIFSWNCDEIYGKLWALEKKPIIIWWKSIRVLVQVLWNFLKVPTLLMRRLLFSVDQCAVVVGSSPLMKKNHLDLFISDFKTVLPTDWYLYLLDLSIRLLPIVIKILTKLETLIYKSYF